MDLEQRRLDLDALLRTLMPEGAEENVYFQPPENLTMEYPCIRYNIGFAESSFADNNPHRYTERFQITIIDEDPDTTIRQRLVETLPMCSFNRWYPADDLNHYVYNVFF